MQLDEFQKRISILEAQLLESKSNESDLQKANQELNDQISKIRIGNKEPNKVQDKSLSEDAQSTPSKAKGNPVKPIDTIQSDYTSNFEINIIRSEDKMDEEDEAHAKIIPKSIEKAQGNKNHRPLRHLLSDDHLENDVTKRIRTVSLYF